MLLCTVVLATFWVTGTFKNLINRVEREVGGGDRDGEYM